MDAEEWKEFQRKGKIIREARLQRHRKFIQNFASDKNLSYEEIQPWQIRIKSKFITMDLFPMSKRYHNISLDRRGTYHKLPGFLNSVFK